MGGQGVLPQPQRVSARQALPVPQVSGAVTCSSGSRLLFPHTAPGATVMALLCSPCTGCSKARPSSVSPTKPAPPDTPRMRAAAVGLSPRDVTLGPCPAAVLGRAELQLLHFAFRHLSAVCNHEDSEMYLLEKEVYEKCCTNILSCE